MATVSFAFYQLVHSSMRDGRAEPRGAVVAWQRHKIEYIPAFLPGTPDSRPRHADLRLLPDAMRFRFPAIIFV